MNLISEQNKMSGIVESKLGRKAIQCYKAQKNFNVARKIVSINHTGKWQIENGL